MTHILSRPDYEAAISESRNQRMAWWRQARFGVFVHYGLYAQLGRNEWVQTLENIPPEEYARLADTFAPKPGAPREWARLASEAGAKYMVMTTRHHEGFSLWDSKANPFNSVNYGPHRDIVREFVDACREYGLRIGFYSSLMDWHHPDAWRCAFDNDARRRFLDFIEAMNTELLTQYGRIDILWYDVAEPMDNWEGWDSLSRNQRLRSLQPDIIINDRSRLPEDFGTPEGSIVPGQRDWEACMTFNDISWGYLDDKQALPYAYSMHRILRMIHTCSAKGGNLLLNIGPRPDGSVPADAVKPLKEVGEWLRRNGECAYGYHPAARFGGNGISSATTSPDEKTVYLWNWIWPTGGEMGIGGYCDAPKRVYILSTGQDIPFTHKGQRILLHDLPAVSPDISGVSVICMEFDRPPEYHPRSYYPQLHKGLDIAGDNKL